MCVLCVRGGRGAPSSAHPRARAQSSTCPGTALHLAVDRIGSGESNGTKMLALLLGSNEMKPWLNFASQARARHHAHATTRAARAACAPARLRLRQQRAFLVSDSLRGSWV